jgi:hypothetical protein
VTAPGRRRLLDVVDHQDIERRLGGFELQAQLLLDGGEDGRPDLLIRGRLVSGRIGIPGEREVVLALEAGAVDDGASLERR